jgi:hypothetical protein
METVEAEPSIYIMGEDKNSGKGKVWRKSDQTFQADFNELLFILLALKLIEIMSGSQPDH